VEDQDVSSRDASSMAEGESVSAVDHATGVRVGIDVGGTFTDGVAVRGGDILATAKVPTQPEDLAASLLGALDGVMRDTDPEDVVRVSLSTTLITNLIAQGHLPKVALVLIPGPGLSPKSYRLPGQPWVIEGAIDFRGRETVSLDLAELDATLAEIQDAGMRHLAVAGKFSPRNASHELAVVERARQHNPAWHLRAGHTVAGELNFPRRAAATALTLAVDAPFRAFYDRVRGALAERGLDCPVVVLKADGGTLPLDHADDHPLESIFSGPAASAMGGLALQPPDVTCVVIDVGGTTTDLALILDGVPLRSSQGGILDGMPLPVRALAVRSLPVGGDSTLTLEGGEVRLLPTRAGSAACLGGPAPTLTDALRVLGDTEVGDRRVAHQALSRLGDPAAVAREVVDQALARIEAGIDEVYTVWQREPVYRLWELRQREARRDVVHVEEVVAVGAGAPALAPALGRRLDLRVQVPAHGGVANALGAALARTTYTTTLHVDTERERLGIAETATSAPLSHSSLSLDEVREMARGWMARRGEALGLSDPLAESVEVLAEQFNHVEGWQTVGRIFDVQLERMPGLIEGWRSSSPADDAPSTEPDTGGNR
jgi:N-methylhydantoinase A/oxoprolinase/acetone carboxylase beta subunit